VDAIRAGTEVASIINKWEKLTAAAPAKILMRRAIALWSDPHSFTMSSGHELARCIPKLTDSSGSGRHQCAGRVCFLAKIGRPRKN
jgi:hypothetical protein